jgi:hypothetical protein
MRYGGSPNLNNNSAPTAVYRSLSRVAPWIVALTNSKTGT